MGRDHTIRVDNPYRAPLTWRRDSNQPMRDEIVWSVADGIATVTLNRPDKRNAMNVALLTGLRLCFERLDERADVRVVLVRGAGPTFCSGMDLQEMEKQRGVAVDNEFGVVAVLHRVERCRYPTIAVLHGDAIAGGCELALHCDLRIAADGARLGMPLARVGLVAPVPLTQKLIEGIGPAFARQRLFTGRHVDAGRAYEMGMVHQVVPAAELEAKTSTLARTVADNAPLSLTGMKAVILRAMTPREIAHNDLDIVVQRARQSADASEG